EIAAEGNRRLLVLGRELHRSHRGFQFMQGGLVLAYGVKKIANASMVIAMIAERDTAFCLGDRRKIEMRPTAFLKQMTDQVVEVQPLHHDNDRTFRFMVEPREQRVGVPLFQ